MTDDTSKDRTLLDRLDNPSWQFVAVVAASLVLLGVAAAALSGFSVSFLGEGRWHLLFMAPTLVVYILITSRVLFIYRDAEIGSLRQISALDNDDFMARIKANHDSARRGAPIALLTGLAFSLLVEQPWLIVADFQWLSLYSHLTSVLMFSLLAWVIYLGMMDTKLINSIERQPLDFDILYLRPFIAIGRQSLRVALAFVGGSTIALLFIFAAAEQFGPDELVVFGILALITVLIFFLPMTQTHTVLRAAKNRKLDEVNRRLADTYKVLANVTEEEREDIVTFSTEARLWEEYETRLRSVNTWPYDLGMLRTLLLSVLVPLVATQLQRLAAQWLS